MSFVRELVVAFVIAVGLMMPGALGVAWVLVHAGLDMPR